MSSLPLAVQTDLDLLQLEVQALRLDELAEGVPGLEKVPTSSERVEARLQRWCEAIAPKSETASETASETGSEAGSESENQDDFEKILAWRGWDLHRAQELLHDHRPGPDFVPASWTEVLSEIIETISDSATNPQSYTGFEAIRDPESPLPFEDVLLPVLAVSRRRLAASLEGHPGAELEQSMDRIARRALERVLLQTLCDRAGQVLAHELARRSLGAQLFSKRAASGDKRHRAFVGEIRRDGLRQLFEDYPALARLLAEAVELWVAGQARFFRRLSRDAEAIAERFGKDPDQIISCCAGLSDPHHGNQSVQALRFASGLEIVYKPRNLDSEQAFGDFLDGCRAAGFPIELRLPTKLCRECYGWVEFIETKPLETEADIPKVFERSGALVCLLYAMRSTDFHSENLIASGAHLVPVDMEAMLHADPAPLGSEEDLKRRSNEVLMSYLGSVLRSGLLPQWTFSGDNSYDYSGIGSLHPENTYRYHGWSGLGSDQLSFGPVEHDLTKRPPRWSLNGNPVDPAQHVADVVRGFEQCYEFLLDARPQLLAEDGPLRFFRGLEQRYIFRATKIYWKVLTSSFSPQAVRSGVDRSIAIDQLSRAYVYPEKPACFPLLRGEREAIECGDIPYFGCISDELTIDRGVEQPVPGVFNNSALEGLCTQLRQLSPADLRVQRDLVASSFATVRMRTPGSSINPELLPEPDASQFADRPPLSPEDCLRHGLALAEKFRERAIVGQDGSAGWITPRIHHGSDKYFLHPMSPGLYSGLDGAAIFLAAADAARKCTENKDLVQRLFFPWFAVDSREALERRPVHGIGLDRGYGSLIYSLCLIGQLYGDEAFFDRALSVLDLIDPNEIDSDDRLDLLGGSAGLLMALSALQQATGSSKPLELALRCGDQLLSQQQSIDGKPAAWRTVGDSPLPLAGLSHGAAGISLSLLKLAAWSHQSRFLDGALQGIAYERAVFDAGRNNWPDYRSVGNDGQVAWMSSWCHGGAGIGMARLATAKLLGNDNQLDAEVDSALASSPMLLGRLDLDHICCGNFGRIELRLLAATQRASTELLRSAYQGAAQLVGRAEQCQGFVLYKGIPGHVFDPQFFQGQAGIGYQLLRLARPELLPSVATFEPFSGG